MTTNTKNERKQIEGEQFEAYKKNMVKFKGQPVKHELHNPKENPTGS